MTASDWADSGDHDYLNGWVGKTISDVTTELDTSVRPEIPVLRLHFRGGRMVEIRGDGEPGYLDGFTVQDVE